MDQGNAESAQIGGQIGAYTGEMREKDRKDNLKRTALHMAQQNNPGFQLRTLLKKLKSFLIG